MSEVTLVNLGGGAAVEKFQEELERVIENILDPNTDAKAKREILLRVVFKPSHDRTYGSVEVGTAAKLAPSAAFGTRAFFGKDKAAGKALAFEDNPKQVTIEDFVQSQQQSNVKTIEARKEAVAK